MINDSSSWHDFLGTLEAGLVTLAARVHQAAPDPTRFGAPVLHKPTAHQAACDEVLIGVGQMVAPNIDSATLGGPLPPLAHDGIAWGAT